MLDDDVGHVTIDLTGEFDIATTAQLRDSILTRHAGESHVLVDLTDVTFMDSSALRALLDVRHTLADHDADLTLANPTENIRRLLTITGTAELFGVSPA